MERKVRRLGTAPRTKLRNDTYATFPLSRARPTQRHGFVKNLRSRRSNTSRPGRRTGQDAGNRPISLRGLPRCEQKRNLAALRGGVMRGAVSILLLLLARAAVGGSSDRDETASGPVSARRTKLYGPALDSRVVTPARFLFIQVPSMGVCSNRCCLSIAFLPHPSLSGMRDRVPSQCHFTF